MKTLTPKHLGLVAMTIVAISAGAIFAIASLDSNQQDASSKAFLMGHVQVTVLDEDGFVKAYRQSDNAIVENGMNMLADNLFSDINGTAVKVNYMEIGIHGEAGSGDANSTNTDLNVPVGGACARVDAAFSTAGASTPAANAEIAVNGTATFTGANCASLSIDEAGVFNHATDGEMFARNTFNDVDLEAADELTLKWDFVFTDS